MTGGPHDDRPTRARPPGAPHAARRQARLAQRRAHRARRARGAFWALSVTDPHQHAASSPTSSAAIRRDAHNAAEPESRAARHGVVRSSRRARRCARRSRPTPSEAKRQAADRPLTSCAWREPRRSHRAGNAGEDLADRDRRRRPGASGRRRARAGGSARGTDLSACPPCAAPRSLAPADSGRTSPCCAAAARLLSGRRLPARERGLHARRPDCSASGSTPALSPRRRPSRSTGSARSTAGETWSRSHARRVRGRRRMAQLLAARTGTRRRPSARRRGVRRRPRAARAGRQRHAGEALAAAPRRQGAAPAHAAAARRFPLVRCLAVLLAGVGAAVVSRSVLRAVRRFVGVHANRSPKPRE